MGIRLIFLNFLYFVIIDGVTQKIKSSSGWKWMLGRVGGQVGKSAWRYSETTEEVRSLLQTN
jgi:hypothetical protein